MVGVYLYYLFYSNPFITTQKRESYPAYLKTYQSFSFLPDYAVVKIMYLKYIMLLSLSIHSGLYLHNVF
ncbi:MAG: hypothetical protein B6D61_12010 [Bacteroidetes bacterium 4484_249]|nr:MAG: hypothetical protein B6D61_12010 [Bacteroidetes bacterium 4484_249]